MSTAGELVIRAWDAREGAALRALGAARGACDALFLPRTEEHWDWALRRNPAGPRLFLARRAERVVACYGALPVRTRVLGETRVFANLLDAWLAPEEGEEEVLLPTARAFLAAHAGAQSDLVHYAWPNARDLRFGKAHLEHELLRASCLLTRASARGASTLPAGVQELERFGPEADHLYACCATHWNASAIRDAAFLNWRFAENPVHRYRLLAVRSGEVLRGFAVYRAGQELQPGLGLLLDWLVLPGDDEAAELLLEAALACARADGAQALAASFPEWSPWSLHFQERGFLHGPSEHLHVVRSPVARFDMLWLRDNWWTTLADVLVL